MAKTIGQLTQATTLASGDEFVIEQSGLTKRVAASVVRGGLVNADIDAAAAIAHTKLANITAGRVLLGNASNVPTATELTGDVTVSNTGVTTLARPLTLATAQNTTSGTSIDFTGIPSWVKRITVMLNGVSTNGSSVPIVQLGSSSFATSGYLGAATQVGSTANTTTTIAFTTGLPVVAAFVATSVIRGIVSIVNVTGNTWVGTSVQAFSDAAVNAFSASNVTLSGTLDRIRLTTVNGTDTFDAGEVNIMYEG
jgi:hypothetical protein